MSSCGLLLPVLGPSYNTQEPWCTSGVEHLLRDVKDSTVSNLTSEVSHMASGLRALKSRLTEVQQYLGYVLEGRLPVNHDIMYGLQVITPVSTCNAIDCMYCASRAYYASVYSCNVVYCICCTSRPFYV